VTEKKKFYDIGTSKELLSLLTVAGDNIAPLVLSIFTFIGRQKPIGQFFSLSFPSTCLSIFPFSLVSLTMLFPFSYIIVSYSLTVYFPGRPSVWLSASLLSFTYHNNSFVFLYLPFRFRTFLNNFPSCKSLCHSIFLRSPSRIIMPSSVSLHFVPSPSVNFFHIFCHSVSLSSDSIYRSSFFDLIHPLTLNDPHILSVCEIITLSLKRVFLDLWCQQKIFASSNIKC